MSNILRARQPIREERPTTKMTSDELLGLVRSARAKTSTNDVAPDIAIVQALETPIAIAEGTQESEPIDLPPELAQASTPLPLARDVPTTGSLPVLPEPDREPLVARIPEPTTLVEVRPGPTGAIVAFALLALTIAVCVLIVV